MSLELAITDHAAALRELAAAIRATISGPHGITATTDQVIAEAKATTPAEQSAKQGGDEKKLATSQPAATQHAAPAAATASRSDAAPPTYDDVKAKVLALSKSKGREPTVALLQRYGVEKAPDLKQEQYADFIADAEKVIAGTYDPEAAQVE